MRFNFIVKFSLISLVCILICSCNPFDNEKMKNKQIKIGQNIYSVDQVKKHLHDMFTRTSPAEEAIKDDIFGIWASIDNRVGYDLFVSADLDVDSIKQKVVDDMEYLSQLTGIDFFRANDLSETQMMIAVTSKYKFVKDIDFIESVNKKDKENFRFYQSLLSSLLDFTDVLLFKRNHKIDRVYQDSNKNKTNIYSLWCGYILIKAETRVLDSLDAVIAAALYSNMFSGDMQSKNIQESVSSRVNEVSPHLYPFDDALIRLVYANPELSGMKVEKAVEIILEKLLIKYGLQ